MASSSIEVRHAGDERLLAGHHVPLVLGHEERKVRKFEPQRGEDAGDLPGGRVMELHPLLQHAAFGQALLGDLVKLAVVQVGRAGEPNAGELDVITTYLSEPTKSTLRPS